MVKKLLNILVDNFTTGLNITDSPHDIRDSDLKIADNVIYRPTGEVESIEGMLQVGNEIYVNGTIATKILGGIKFNGLIYLMASNSKEARLVYLDTTLSGSITVFSDAGGGFVTVTSNGHNLNNNDTVSITGTTNYDGTYVIENSTTNTFDITATWAGDDATGTWTSTGWTEATSQNFDSNSKCDFAVYNNKMWFVNGQTTNSNVLNFLDTSNTLTGLTTSSGLVSGINRLVLHLERFWISKGNNIYVSRQYPTGSDDDWDGGRVYSGSDASGLIQLDNDTEDQIKSMVSHFGQLTVFREFRINVVTGKSILTATIEKSFNSRGIIADFSVGRSDQSLYFLSREGVKRFQGITTQDQTTQFDSISTVGLDRKIRTEIEAFSDQTAARGYAFKDKFYLSDGDSTILVFDEITGGWSKWNVGGAEVFIENGDNIFCANEAKYYQLNADTSASFTSTIKTKDFNLGSDQFYKIFEKLIATFKTMESSQTITLQWYINGSTTASGTKEITLLGSGIEWDATGITWDSGIKWDSGDINFLTEKKRKLKSGITIAFGVTASGTNRFSLSALDLLYEPMRRES